MEQDKSYSNKKDSYPPSGEAVDPKYYPHISPLLPRGRVYLARYDSNLNYMRLLLEYELVLRSGSAS